MEPHFLLVFHLNWWGSIFYVIIGELMLLLNSDAEKRQFYRAGPFLSLVFFLLVVCLVY